MKHVLCASALAVAALVLTATAVAVPPSGGATYRGNSSGQRNSLPLPVELKVAADGKSLTFTVRCRFDGRRWRFSLKGVKVNAQGRLLEDRQVPGFAAQSVGQVRHRQEGLRQVRHRRVLRGRRDLHRQEVAADRSRTARRPERRAVRLALATQRCANLRGRLGSVCCR
jgi:hypothetical protein